MYLRILFEKFISKVNTKLLSGNVENGRFTFMYDELLMSLYIMRNGAIRC